MGNDIILGAHQRVVELAEEHGFLGRRLVLLVAVVLVVQTCRQNNPAIITISRSCIPVSPTLTNADDLAGIAERWQQRDVIAQLKLRLLGRPLSKLLQIGALRNKGLQVTGHSLQTGELHQGLLVLGQQAQALGQVTFAQVLHESHSG